MTTVTDDLYELIKDALPDDHARQVLPSYFIELVLGERPGGQRVLDLGCGDGRSVDTFRQHDPTVDWHGLDVEVSPEVATRTRTDATFASYDGLTIPYPDRAFDIVYSNQVFEHVRHPDRVLAEVARVLVPGGAFIGSVSALEPYHSLSYWNFTPFGWYRMLRDAGLAPVQLRPGIDAIALIQRAYLRRPQHSRAWWTSSPLNEEIDRWAADGDHPPSRVNLRKLHYAGHVNFYARKA
jgi:SAM-dependent methyltransferase